MRILIDLELASLKHPLLPLAKQLITKRPHDEVFLVLPKTVPDFITKEFASLLPLENIKVWHPLQASHEKNQINTLLKEAFLETLSPDLVLLIPIPSLTKSDDNNIPYALFLTEEISLPPLKTLLLQADLIVAASPTVKEALLKTGLPPEKIKNPSEFLTHISSKKHPQTKIKHTSIFHKKEHKILVLKLDHMGDFILAIPALSKLKSRYPHAFIDIIVGSWNREIAEKTGFFHNVFCFDYFKKKSSLPPSGSLHEFQSLLPHPYDIAIDLRREPDTRMFLKPINAPLKVGYETFDPLLDAEIDLKLKSYNGDLFPKTFLSSQSISLQMVALIDALPHDVNDFIHLPHLVTASPIKGHIALFPKSGNEAREWDKHHYLELIHLFNTSPNIHKINLYFSSETEAQDFIHLSSEKISFHNGLELNAFLNSLTQNSLCIGNNSYGVHIASYLNIPTIGLYSGHEIPEEWGPMFHNAYTFSSPLPCSPCHFSTKEECPHNLLCLKMFSAQEIYSFASRLLNEESPPASIKPSESQAKLIQKIKALNLSSCDDSFLLRLSFCIRNNFSPLHHLAIESDLKIEI